MIEKNKQLLNVINRIQRELSWNLEELNSGGCIHFAYYFSNALSLLDIPHKIFLCNRKEYGKVYRTYQDFMSVSHVLVYIDGIGFIDGHKCTSLKEVKREYAYRISSFKMDLDRLRREYEWNWMYDPEEGNPMVIDTIKKYLDDYTG